VPVAKSEISIASPFLIPIFFRILPDWSVITPSALSEKLPVSVTLSLVGFG